MAIYICKNRGRHQYSGERVCNGCHQDLEAERDKLKAKLKRLNDAVTRCDIVAQKEEDAEGFITGYRFKTGAWHALLGEFAKD